MSMALSAQEMSVLGGGREAKERGSLN